MQQFQLSVFYEGGFLSYDITTEDAVLYRFDLKSAPQASYYAPAHFAVRRNATSWAFDADLEPGFKKSVMHTLKKAKV